MSFNSKLPAWPEATALSKTSVIWLSLMPKFCMAAIAMRAMSSVVPPLPTAAFCKVGRRFLATSILTEPDAIMVFKPDKASSLLPPPTCTAFLTEPYKSCLPAMRPCTSRSAYAVLAAYASSKSKERRFFNGSSSTAPAATVAAAIPATTRPPFINRPILVVWPSSCRKPATCSLVARAARCSSF